MNKIKHEMEDYFVLRSPSKAAAYEKYSFIHSYKLDLKFTLQWSQNNFH